MALDDDPCERAAEAMRRIRSEGNTARGVVAGIVGAAIFFMGIAVGFGMALLFVFGP